MKGETTYLTSHFDCISHSFIHRWTIVDPENYERHIIESYFIFNRRNVTNVIFNLWTIVMRRYHHTNWIHLNQMTSNWKRRKKIDILFFNTFDPDGKFNIFILLFVADRCALLRNSTNYLHFEKLNSSFLAVVSTFTEIDLWNLLHLLECRRTPTEWTMKNRMLLFCRNFMVNICLFLLKTNILCLNNLHEQENK